MLRVRSGVKLTFMLLWKQKLAFKDRAKYYADMAFIASAQQWLSKQYAAQRKPLIDLNRAAKRFDAGPIKGIQFFHNRR